MHGGGVERQWGITHSGRLDLLQCVCVSVCVWMCKNMFLSLTGASNWWKQGKMGSHDSCEPSSFMHQAVFFVLPFLSYSAPPAFPSSHSVALWRGKRIIHSDMVWCFGFIFFLLSLLSVATHPHYFHSFLNSALWILYFRQWKGAGGLSTAWLCCFCGSHDVNLLNVCRPPLLAHQRSWLKTERWRMLVCFCWSTSSQMESKHGFSMSYGCVLQTWAHVVHMFTDGTGIFLIYLRC